LSDWGSKSKPQQSTHEVRALTIRPQDGQKRSQDFAKGEA